MFTRSRVLILALIVLILRGVFSLPVEARRIKDVKYPALSLAYSSLNGATSRADSITDSVYPYPMIVSSHPLSTGLWIEKMVQEGSLNRGATLIYLSPYPCYTTGEIKRWQDSNWVRFVLEREYIKRALIVVPSYMHEETLIKDRLSNTLSTAEHDISLLDSLVQLSEYSDLGEVILVIDASYFSNQETPRYTPIDVDSVTGYPISLIFSTYNALSGLRAKGLDIRAVVYNTSPGFPHLGHAAIIQEWLLFYLEKIGL